MNVAVRERVTTDDILARARELYEASRRKVGGRPKWGDLNPEDAYDMGMQETAIIQAMDEFHV